MHHYNHVNLQYFRLNQSSAHYREVDQFKGCDLLCHLHVRHLRSNYSLSGIYRGSAGQFEGTRAYSIQESLHHVLLFLRDHIVHGSNWRNSTLDCTNEEEVFYSD